MTKQQFWHNFRQILVIFGASIASAVSIELLLLPCNGLYGQSDPCKMPGGMGVWQPYIRGHGCGNCEGEKVGQDYPLFHRRIGGG